MTTPEQTLQTLAALDPDYPAFAAALPPEALPAGHAPLPEGFAEDVIALLETQRPELSPWLGLSPSTPVPEKMAVDLLGVSVLAAILFLLRTHIKIKGKHFIIEHKPMGDALLEKVLGKLSSLLGDKAG